jgi:hypothetical protein
MKLVQLLIGDHEYKMIQEIFEKEDDFTPMTETDKILIQTMRAVISPKNIVEDDVIKETESLEVKKVIEPEDKDLETGNVEFKI